MDHIYPSFDPEHVRAFRESRRSGPVSLAKSDQGEVLLVEEQAGEEGERWA